MKKIIIKSDVFNICKRIKSVNENFFICFNRVSKKYEIHNKSLSNTFCYTIPFNGLDYRTITFLLTNLKKKAKDVFLEIEANNKKIENQSLENIKDEALWKIKEISSYANISSKDFKVEDLSTNWA